jgi:hypothetical protein
MFIMTLYDRTRQHRCYRGPSGTLTCDRNAVNGWESAEEATKAADAMRDFVSLDTDIWLETQ